MCGRIVLKSPPHTLAEEFFLDLVPQLLPRFNIAPGQDIAAVLPNPDSEGRLLRMLRWGLVPPWSRDERIGPKLINARSETVGEKPAFREAFAGRRCLIPVDGFYEWRRQPEGRQPHYFRRRDGRIFALAGLWQEWDYPGGRRLETCTILTTAANSVMRPIHHRMPVILPPADWKFWLDLPQQKQDLLRDMLQPAPADLLLAHPVDRMVNSPACDRPECIEPTREQPDGQMDLFA